MWVEENKISTVENLFNFRAELEPILIQVLNDRTTPLPEFCPQCGKKPVNKRYDQVAFSLKACPDGHGAWLTPQVAEKIRDFIDSNEGKIPAPVNRKYMGFRLVAIFIGIALGIVSGYWKDNHKSKSTAVAPSPKISSQYWPSRIFKNWYPLPENISGMDSQELAYWKIWCAIMEIGISNRMNVQEALDADNKTDEYFAVNNKYRQSQEYMIQRLSDLPQPERLKPFHQYVLSAADDQMRFYEEYTKARAGNKNVKFEEFRENADLKAGDQKLWDAYHNFQSLYPSRDKATNDAIERRLAWFDII